MFTRLARGRTAHHRDEAQGYCGACHEVTAVGPFEVLAGRSVTVQGSPYHPAQNNGLDHGQVTLGVNAIVAAFEIESTTSIFQVCCA